MKAVRLKQVDMDYRNHLQAFLNLSVKAEKKIGKFKSVPVYSTFKKFYDFEKAVENVLKPNAKEDRFRGVREILRKGDGEDGGKL